MEPGVRDRPFPVNMSDIILTCVTDEDAALVKENYLIPGLEKLQLR